MTFNLGVIDFRDGQQSILLEMKKDKIMLSSGIWLRKNHQI
jgi:hypothetical protein